MLLRVSAHRLCVLSCCPARTGPLVFHLCFLSVHIEGKKIVSAALILFFWDCASALMNDIVCLEGSMFGWTCTLVTAFPAAIVATIRE
jgi:hypothetical protein